MKTLKSIYIIIFFLSTSCSLYAQDLETVKSEIKTAALKEQSAFKNGKCEQVLASMEENITFLANGRKVPSKSIIGKFCNSIPRPFKTTTHDKLDVYPLTSHSGYSIRTLEYPKDDYVKMQEYVTKIWRKTEGMWKTIHLHSTVKEGPITN